MGRENHPVRLTVVVILVINNPTRIAVNGKPVEVESPLTIRVGNVDVVTMA